MHTGRQTQAVAHCGHLCGDIAAVSGQPVGRQRCLCASSSLGSAERGARRAPTASKKLKGAYKSFLVLTVPCKTALTESRLGPLALCPLRAAGAPVDCCDLAILANGDAS